MIARIAGNPWLWGVWWAALLTCPTGLVIVAVAYPSVPIHPPPWTQGDEAKLWAEQLCWTHAGVSIMAALAAPLLIRRWWIVPIAWLVVAAWMYGVFIFTLGVAMDKMGGYF